MTRPDRRNAPAGLGDLAILHTSFFYQRLHAGVPRDVDFLIEIVELKAQADYGSAVMFPIDPAFTSRCTTDKNNNDVQKAYQPWKP
jgi:hypothetical protein